MSNDLAITPMGLLQLALEKESNIDVIERLANLQRQEREYQATVDFDDALSRCQAKLKRVAADMTNPQTRSQYASYAALDRAIRPEYVGEGFSISFITPKFQHVADILRTKPKRRCNFFLGGFIDSSPEIGENLVTGNEFLHEMNSTPIREYVNTLTA